MGRKKEQQPIPGQGELFPKKLGSLTVSGRVDLNPDWSYCDDQGRTKRNRWRKTRQDALKTQNREKEKDNTPKK